MFVADLHNDVLQRAINGEDIINKTSNGHSDIERLIEAKINLEVFVVWITKQYLKHSPFNRANELINKLEEIERKSQNLTIVRSYHDIISINKKSHLAAAFGIEGGECLENNIDNLDYFIKKGLLQVGKRALTMSANALDDVSKNNTSFKGAMKNQIISSLPKGINRGVAPRKKVLTFPYNRQHEKVNVSRRNVQVNSQNV